MVASKGNNMTRRDTNPLVNKKQKIICPRNNSNAIFNPNQINDQQLMDPGYMDFNIPARPIIKSSMQFKKNRQPPNHIRLPPPQIMNNQRVPLLPPPFQRRMGPPPMRSMPPPHLPPPINRRFCGPRHNLNNMMPPPPPMLRPPPHPIMTRPPHPPMGPPLFLMGPMGPRNGAGHPLRRNKNNRRNNRSKPNVNGGGIVNNRNRRIQVNKYDINKPWVTDEIREIFNKKVELENKLKGNKNDQLFAEFKNQRDKFVKMYEARHLEFIGKHDKKVIHFF